MVYTDLDPGNAGSAHKTIIQTSDIRMNDYSEYQNLSFYVRANRVEPAGVVIDHGKGLVGIDGGIAVAGKVLAARRHAVLL